MTTHRNLKPHYAEPKGKSGPVIVVKKGEVMSEPTTEAGKALRDEQDNIALVAVHPHADYMTACWLCDRIIAIEQEARANADRELRELRDAADDLEKAVFGWFGAGQEAPTVFHARTRLRRALDSLAASERKS